MSNKIVSLTTEFKESYRFNSFSNDTFIVLPALNALITKHDDCLYGLSIPKYDPKEDILLSKDFLTGASDVTREYYRNISNNDRVLCILNSKEDNLYETPHYNNKCVISGGGLSTFNVNTKGDVLTVCFCNSIISSYQILSDSRTEEATSASDGISESKPEKDNKSGGHNSTTSTNQVDSSSKDWIYLSLLKSIKTNLRNITSISYHTNDEYLACGIVDGNVVIYHNYILYHTFNNLKSMVSIIKFCPNTNWLVVGTQIGDIMLYDIKSKVPLIKFEDHMSYVTDLIFIITLDNKPGGFITSSRDTIVNFWSLDIKVGKNKKSIQIHKPFKRILIHQSICSINIVTNHKYSNNWILLVATYDGNIKFINPTDDNVLNERLCSYGQGGLRCLRYIDSTNSLISLGINGSLCIYNDSLHIQHQLLGNIDPIFHFKLCKINPTVELKSLSDDMCDYSYSIEWLNRERLKNSVLMFVLIGDEIIRLLSLNSGEYITMGLFNEDHRHSDVVLSLSYSEKEDILISSSKDEKIIIWDLITLVANTIITIDSLSLACVEISNFVDENRFHLATSGDNVLKTFDIKLKDRNTYIEPQLLNSNNSTTAIVHKKVINTIAFSPNNKMLATGGGDKMIVIYTLENLIIKGKCMGHKRSVISLEFMKTTKMIISSSVDETIKIWNLNDYTCVKTFQGHTKPVMRVLLLPNDMQILSSSMDGLIKLWNIRTSDCIHTIDNHNDKVWDMELYGSDLISISGGKIIYCVDITDEVERNRLEKEREDVLKCTQIDILYKEGRDYEALNLAVELKKHNIARDIIIKSCNKLLYNNEYNDNIFKNWIKHLKLFDDLKIKLTAIFDFIQIWISNNKTAWIANCIIYEILNQFKPNEIFIIEGLSHRIDSILIHQSTHYSRLLNLMEKSHILDILIGYKHEDNHNLNTNNSITRKILYD